MAPGRWEDLELRRILGVGTFGRVKLVLHKPLWDRRRAINLNPNVQGSISQSRAKTVSWMNVPRGLDQVRNMKNYET